MAKFYTRYNPAPKAGLVFKQASKTQTQFKTEADINHLINRYKNAGSFYDPLNPPRGEKRLPMFSDFSTLPEFQNAQNIISEAQSRFEALPARTRKFFDNDPTLLIAFVNDPANRDKAIELGLVSAPVEEPVVPVKENPVPATPIPGEPTA